MKWDVPCRQTLASRCSARLTLQLASKHAQLTVTTGSFGFSALDGSFHPAGHFLEEALLNDNVNLETIPKIASSGAQNRCVGFAIATLLEAKLSAAQNGAIQGTLSHLPPPLYPVDSGWLPIVSAAIHHDSFEQDVTQRHSLPPRGARHIGIRAKERKRTPLYRPPPSPLIYNRECRQPHRTRRQSPCFFHATLFCSARVARRLAWPPCSTR